MSIIKWTDDLILGIEEMDVQHRKLVDLINDFYDGLKSKSNDELIAELIKGVNDYTLFHFSAEERLLNKYNYTDTAGHTNEHNDFKSKLSEIESRFKSGRLILSFELTNLLKDWLINHIKVSDKQYAAFIKQQRSA